MPTTTIADDDGPDLDTLENQGRRHRENLDGLQKHDAFLAAEIVRHEVELVAAEDHLAKLPADAGAVDKLEAKQAVSGIEFNRDLLVEQRANLAVELTATPKLIADNAKATLAAKAEL